MDGVWPINGICVSIMDGIFYMYGVYESIIVLTTQQNNVYIYI